MKETTCGRRGFTVLESTALVPAERDRDGAAITVRMGEQMPAAELFKGRQFDREVTVLCVRW